MEPETPVDVIGRSKSLSSMVAQGRVKEFVSFEEAGFISGG